VSIGRVSWHVVHAAVMICSPRSGCAGSCAAAASGKASNAADTNGRIRPIKRILTDRFLSDISLTLA
jgi:hypothetical protein